METSYSEGSAPPCGPLRRGKEGMTFVIAGGEARLTKVEIDHNSGIAIEVRSGLREGQQVVLHPPHTVSEALP